MSERMEYHALRFFESMVTIKLICVGKIKEAFYRDAADEYKKRLSRYAKVTITELQDEKTPDSASKAEEQAILAKEGERILKAVSPSDYVIELAVKGKTFTSEGLAAHLDALMLQGKSSIAFVIGGSLGTSPEVSARADDHLSFSALTFPHQLMRVILLEQIYRSFRILKNEPYHK